MWCVIVGMIYQFCVMMHFTHCRSSHCTYCISMWWRASPFAVFFRVLARCYDVDASCDYKGSISQARHRKSHASHHGGMFIYKNDSEEGPSNLNLCGQLIFQGKRRRWMIFESGGRWRCCESLEETAEDRRSISVLTQITATFNRNLKTMDWTLILYFHCH